jgi:phosphopantothenoylcysteine decarboxylase/phosphopantothenate--cysteine ligase
MAEPDDMVKHIARFFSGDKSLKGLHALVTAGPTYERIDPVRFIGNFSSGKMGIAVAEALAERGAEVTLVLGPSHYTTHEEGIRIVAVESAQQMYDASIEAYKKAHIAVMAAAVADYKPASQASEKIKKKEGELTLALVKTNDILSALGKIKQPWQTLVGFALETENELVHAKEKLENKNADMVVMNSLRDEGAGFGHDTNKITLLKREGDPVTLPLQSKVEAAKHIVDHILELRHVKETA